ncbi:hypothetical protein PoB_004056700 [Plakobranchus ocellatus]|uniref:Motile sperm domain-containing protein 1 n=1 Tax=Plakobranchus ocellatus TaxID=259542 RepID=A0AAV4B3H6_9GAST|nr:hypothetical protein PoB_004056700 [Plakobranchus ocellatus]
MPITPTPYVIPSTLVFYLSEQTRTVEFCVYNPFPHDILFKVDNAYPDKYTVSLKQGVVSTRQKITLQLTCTSREASLEDGVQVRFFKWSRPRHGQRPRAQQYVGFRSIKVFIYNNRNEDPNERESTPSDTGSTSALSGSGRGGAESSRKGYQNVAQSERRNSDPDGTPDTSKRMQVITNLVTVLTLLACGFALNKTSEEWLSSNILEGIKPQTLAIVSYTLAFVVLIKLLTFR